MIVIPGHSRSFFRSVHNYITSLLSKIIRVPPGPELFSEPKFSPVNYPFIGHKNFSMQGNQKKISAGGMTVLMFVIGNVVILEKGFVSDPAWYKLAYFSFPLLLISLFFNYRKQW